MTAPEKIYVCIPTRLQRDDPKYVGIAWSDKAYLTTPQIEEYIRKDAVDETIKSAEDHAYFAGQEKFREKLLEWLEQNRNQSQMWFDRYHEKEDLSAKQVWEEVIDKLNSM